MNQGLSSEQAIENLREAGQSLEQAIRRRDGEAALFLAKRYEEALHAALAAEPADRNALIREAADWLQEKIAAAIRIRAEISSEINEVQSQKKVIGNPGKPNGGGNCSFVV